MHTALPRQRLLGWLVSLLVLFGTFLPAHASEVWARDSDRDGITIYTRQRPGQVLKDFKGLMQVDAPLSRVAAVLGDLAHMSDWFYLLHEARFIKGERSDDFHMYLAIDGIWPVRPRDVVAHVTVAQDPESLAITVTATSEAGVLPPVPGFVRMPAMRSTWRLRVLSATRTEIEIEGQADPGGMVPTFLANFGVTELPRQSLAKMRLQIARPEYGDLTRLYARVPRLRELGNRLVFPNG